jgi:biopolymer transport protein TolQ
MAKFVLALLGCFSITSWAIMAERFRTLGKAEKESSLFLRKFNDAGSLSELIEYSKLLSNSPLARIFDIALKFSNPSPGTSRSSRILKRELEKRAAMEIQRMERFLSFLATTASVTPFVGLFGTVWGIMNAFRGIGMAGTASIAAYAPGIAEALVTTAAGLAAAIPAVIGYNHFLRKVRVQSTEIDEFTEDLIARIEESH